MAISKWYRGHSGKRNALENFGVIWLTDDIEYAQVYAEDDGIVSVVYIDDSKLKPADWWYNIDFEPYFPDDEEIDEFKQDGYNCYYFMANYDYDDFQCLALFSKEPVVKIEQYNTTKLNENELKYIIKETVNLLTEHYHGDLYHFTTLPLLYSICKQNNLIPDKPDNIVINRKGTTTDDGYSYDSICFTRDKNYNIRNGYDITCRLTFDADKLMKIRYAKLYPINYSGKMKMNHHNEAEERLYGVCIEPLHEYVKCIDIFVNNLNAYSNTDLEDEFYEKYYDNFFTTNPNATDDDFNIFINKKIIKNILSLKKFKGKINVYNKQISNTIKENVSKVPNNNETYKDFINEVLTDINEYLSEFKLSCSINAKYDFSGYYKDCVAVYQYRSVMNNGKMRIALNMPLIMSHGLNDDETKEQIEISMWHEIGHGIVQWIKSLRRRDTQAKTGIFKGKIVKDLRYILNNEEDVVEEFGVHRSGYYGYSILDDFINEYEQIIKA